MFDLRIDMRQFEAAAERIGGAADQLPFVLSGLLNDAVFKARTVLTESTWPQHVHVRKKGFLTAALRVEKATKGKLSAGLYDHLGRAALQLHAKGGTKRARRRLAIPQTRTWQAVRTASGVRKADRPAAIIASTPAGALRVTDAGIFVGAGGRLHLRYTFKPAARQPADVPFYEDFSFVVMHDMAKSFSDRMASAMSTRR